MPTPTTTVTHLAVPHVPPGLAEWLALLFPNRLPSSLHGGLEDVARKIGQQDVIGRLQQEVARQARDSLTESLLNVSVKET